MGVHERRQTQENKEEADGEESKGRIFEVLEIKHWTGVARRKTGTEDQVAGYENREINERDDPRRPCESQGWYIHDI